MSIGNRVIPIVFGINIANILRKKIENARFWQVSMTAILRSLSTNQKKQMIFYFRVVTKQIYSIWLEKQKKTEICRKRWESIQRRWKPVSAKQRKRR